MVGGGIVPPFFRNTGERAIASYSFTDVINGIGYIDMYLMGTNNYAVGGGSPNYQLFTGNSLKAKPNYIEVGDAGGGGATTTTYIFSGSKLLTPMRVGGTAYLNYGFYKVVGDGTSCAFSGSIIVDNNGTKTILANYESGGVTTDKYLMTSQEIADTTIPAGAQIILSVHGTVTAGSSQTTYYVGADPSNSTLGTAPFSNSKMSLPIKLEL